MAANAAGRHRFEGGPNTTFVGALKLGGLTAPMLLDGPITGGAFLAHVGQVLVPTRAPGDIVVLDNIQAHTPTVVCAALEAVAAELLFLPPFSPDFNPVEMAFSELKAHWDGPPRLLTAECSNNQKEETMPRITLPRDAAVFGIDLGKTIFRVVSRDKAGAIVQCLKFRRDKVLAFFETATPALSGMEACPGSQWFARKLQVMGHTVRIMPAQFVKPYLMTNKSDTLYAEAIAEAVTRPSMRFVPVKTVDQVDIQALHRTRDQMIGKRTALINQMRAFCLEYGVAIRQGTNLSKAHFPRFLGDEDNDLSPSMRPLLSDLFEDLQCLELRIKTVTSEIEALVARGDVARRLTTNPRHRSAWRQCASGGSRRRQTVPARA